MLNEFRVSVKVFAPVDQVWNKLVNWQSQGEWMALTKVWSSADQDGKSGVGTVIEAFTGIGPFGVLDEMRITKWDPPTFCAVDHYGKYIKGLGEFTLVGLSPDVTRFDWHEKIDAPSWLLTVIKPGILIAVRYSLWKFARTLRA